MRFHRPPRLIVLAPVWLAATIAGLPILAQESPQSEQAPQAEDRRRPYIAPARVSQTVVFGAHQRQQVDIYEPDEMAGPRPIIVFIHGGAWSIGNRRAVQAKPRHFNRSGYVFAATGYRLLPDHPVEQQAADIGAALRALRGQADAIGFDPDRIVLMGHSAGAHLAALVATDPTYAGDAFGAIRGVVLLDGAGYDVPAHIAAAGPRGWQLYTNVFGSDPDRQAALSPVTHVGGPDAPHWLALYVGRREIARSQSHTLVDRLIATGAQGTAMPIPDTNHGRINRELGTQAGAVQTQAVDAFLAELFGP